MTMWYDEPALAAMSPEELAALAAQMRRERDKAMDECAAAGTQLAAAKRQIADLLADLEALRERKFGQVPADILRQADQDRANAVRREIEIRAVWLVNEDLLRELAVLRALVGEPVTT